MTLRMEQSERTLEKDQHCRNKMAASALIIRIFTITISILAFHVLLIIQVNGNHLICANMPGNNVAVFRIDPKLGGLTSVGDPVEMPKPSCVMLGE